MPLNIFDIDDDSDADASICFGILNGWCVEPEPACANFDIIVVCRNAIQRRKS